MESNGNPGIHKLAEIMVGRMHEESKAPPVLDFGTIQADYSLLTDTFQKAIPKSSYSVCRSAAYGKEHTELTGGGQKVRAF